MTVQRGALAMVFGEESVLAATAAQIEHNAGSKSRRSCETGIS